MKAGMALLALAVFGYQRLLRINSLELRPENTKIQWTLSDVIHTVNGTFRLKRGHVDFDPATGKASGQVVIHFTSGNSGNEARDRRMHANVLEFEALLSG
jgi:polyisoprenoid-binding protein YceI